MMSEIIDVSTFKEGIVPVDDYHFVFTVKSKDQLARRRRMVQNLERGAVARVSQRAVSKGFIGVGRLAAGSLVFATIYEADEPRHISIGPDANVFVTTASNIVRLDDNLEFCGSIENKLFSFLHSIERSADGQRFLVCSTGYDTVLEIDVHSGDALKIWYAWERGFNPDLDGNWLTFDNHQHEKWRSEGKTSVLVTPGSNAYGIAQTYRSAHPNFACYNGPYAILVHIAFSGALYSINLEDMSHRLILKRSPMAHGLRKLSDGWALVETTEGKWTEFTNNFEERGGITAKNLGRRHADSGTAEWLQHVLFLDETKAVFFDANRGIYAADLKTRTIQFFETPEDYCFQDAILLGRS
ncbi:hypothetical protein MUU53_20935 [Rhizobium lemnae]|uniref:Uncharacterized protein n=1 Tax=Rhizobium lemnae TaxID=1214924 RepID=A0ABV8E507_9HYPH|nr:hypothetical protein [Rhizobium lemnae]MCJ8510353.1 hypothetical protein [Rhizobium lemnae]